MNNEILIVLRDGTVYSVDEKQAEAVSNAVISGKTKHIQLKEGLISIGGISHLADAKTYYEQHPNKKPTREPFFKNFSALKEPVIKYSDARHKIRLEKMKKGFLKGARVKSSAELSNKQSTIYNKIEKALNRIEQMYVSN